MTARKTKKAVWTVALLTVMIAAASAATYIRLPDSTAAAAAASRAQTITIYQDNENTAHTGRADDDLAYDYPLPLSHEARSVSIEVRFDLTESQLPLYDSQLVIRGRSTRILLYDNYKDVRHEVFVNGEPVGYITAPLRSSTCRARCGARAPTMCLSIRILRRFPCSTRRAIFSEWIRSVC